MGGTLSIESYDSLDVGVYPVRLKVYLETFPDISHVSSESFNLIVNECEVRKVYNP